MKRTISLSILTISLLLNSGCKPFGKSNSSKNIAQNIEEGRAFKVDKTYNLSSNYNREITLNSNIDYLKIIGGADAKLFTVDENRIKLKIKPNYNNPQDSNHDNIYEVIIYGVDQNGDEYKYNLKIIIKKPNNSNGNNTGGGDNNNSGGGVVLVGDSDNDYIPDNIENMLHMDSSNSDENGNGILDGLEGDTFFNKQWYIKADGTPTNPSNVSSIVGNDMNLLDVYKKYMGYNSGNPIVVQIVDSGIDANHEDLKDNMDLSKSLNGDKNGNPIPGGFYKPHGTMLAGIVAARAFNSKGVRGVAPFAKIAGSNWLVSQSLEALEAAWLSGDGANNIAVTNNSWGKYYTTDTFYEDILKEGSNTLRNKKGRVYVFASGNSRAYEADANIQYILNNQYAIVVGAVGVDNKVAKYSTPGANLWISTYGGSSSYNSGPTIATTYLSGKASATWSEDENKNYTYAMAGTSAAAPMVSGSIALILEACPNLTWRDVKYVIAKSAKQNDINNKNWITNSQGFHFNRDYGFGLIDTKKAIDICSNGYNNLPSQTTAIVNKSLVDTHLHLNNEFSVNIDKSLKIEWIELKLDIHSHNASDYDIYLTSPSGTKILMIKNGTKIGSQFIPTRDWMKGGFRFSTGAFIDENSLGEWKIEIEDKRGENHDSSLKSIEIKAYGH